MKPIHLNTIINRISTRADGSLSLSMETPELTNEAILVMLRLRGINLDCVLTPLNTEVDTPEEVKKEINIKTPSQRIRACLFVLFRHEIATNQIPEDSNFEVFYMERTEKIINWLKTKLPEQ